MKSTNEYILDGMISHKNNLERKTDALARKYLDGGINLADLVSELDSINKILVELDLNINLLSPQSDEIPF